MKKRKGYNSLGKWHTDRPMTVFADGRTEMGKRPRFKSVKVRKAPRVYRVAIALSGLGSVLAALSLLWS